MGRVVALGVPDPEQGTEAVVVLVEPSERKPEALAALRARVDRVLREERGLAPKEIVLLPAGTLERTSSGKLMRRRMRDRYLGGELAALALG
jgi:acyl-coenzyme A synthetase/AMP-(fatty) acid ligase